MDNTFRWGIVGLGKIAHHFVRDLALLPQARVQAVASRSDERAQAFAQQYGIPQAFGSYEALAEVAGLDAVYIATPHPDHARLAIFFLERGIPVLCEKPLAMNSQEVEAMIQCAQQRGVFLMEALWTRFLPATEQLLKLQREGALGELSSLKADFGFKAVRDPESRLFNPALGGGALLDIGIYPLFLALLLWGPPAALHGKLLYGDTGVDEEMALVLEYSGNRVALLHATFRHTTSCEAQLFGSKGQLRIHPRWHESRQLTLKPYEGPEEQFHFERRGKGYHYEQAHVMHCIRQGLPESPLLPLAFSRELMQLMEAVTSNNNTSRGLKNL
jgi:predicted dehydrogenase